MKMCTCCGQAKHPDEFYASRAKCKACFNAQRFDTCGCGTRKRKTAALCRTCQCRSIAKLGGLADKPGVPRLAPETKALRRAKLVTRRWLRSETGKRCPLCAKRVRSKNGARYCSYDCWKTTQVPMGQRRHISRGTRARVFARDGYVCQICHRPTSVVHDPKDDFSPEIDHIVPVYDGGVSIFENLRVAHRVCNRDRNLVLYSA